MWIEAYFHKCNVSYARCRFRCKLLGWTAGNSLIIKSLRLMKHLPSDVCFMMSVWQSAYSLIHPDYCTQLLYSIVNKDFDEVEKVNEVVLMKKQILSLDEEIQHRVQSLAKTHIADLFCHQLHIMGKHHSVWLTVTSCRSKLFCICLPLV